MKKFLISILILIIVAVPVGITIYHKAVTPTGLNYKQYKQGIKTYNLIKDYESEKITKDEFKKRFYSYTKALSGMKGGDECWNHNELCRAFGEYERGFNMPDEPDSFRIENGETIDDKKLTIDCAKGKIEAILNIGEE